MKAAALLAFGLATAAGAEVTPPPGQDIYILGEVHDNPAHHALQARLVADIAPGAVVWEMLSPDRAQAVAGLDLSDAAAMAAALDWDASGWPDFAMYHPVFLAAGPARHWGAEAPRDRLMHAMEDGLPAAIGAAEVARWGLGPLSPADQAAREAEQREAHCNALPEDLLPGMVAAQRLRDWSLASAAVSAAEAGQAPVVIITGTGHARRDTGVPALIAAARPDLRVWSLGQVEDGPDPAPTALFDALSVTPAPPRADPCLAFGGSD